MPSKIITRKEKAATTAETWIERYAKNLQRAQLCKQLLELGNSPDPDTVDAVIGNKSWTRLICDGCYTDQEIIVQVGDPKDCESNTADLCQQCVIEALSKLLKATP